MLMRNKFYLIAIILFVMAGGAMAQSGSEAEVNGLLQKMTDAQTNFKSEELDKILSSDYIEISPIGEFDTREKVLGFYKPEAAGKAPKPKVTISEQKTRVYKNFAVSIAKITYIIEVNGKEMPPINMRITYVTRKEKGAWKICSVQYTGIRPPKQQ